MQALLLGARGVCSPLFALCDGRPVCNLIIRLIAHLEIFPYSPPPHCSFA
jgi:hypothetical protein